MCRVRARCHIFRRNHFDNLIFSCFVVLTLLSFWVQNLGVKHTVNLLIVHSRFRFLNLGWLCQPCPKTIFQFGNVHAVLPHVQDAVQTCRLSDNAALAQCAGSAGKAAVAEKSPAQHSLCICAGGVRITILTSCRF